MALKHGIWKITDAFIKNQYLFGRTKKIILKFEKNSFSKNHAQGQGFGERTRKC